MSLFAALLKSAVFLKEASLFKEGRRFRLGKGVNILVIPSAIPHTAA